MSVAFLHNGKAQVKIVCTARHRTRRRQVGLLAFRSLPLPKYMNSMRLLFSLLLLAGLAACSPNNVSEDSSLGSFFTDNGARGCFALFNNNNGQFTVYNLERFRDSAYSPASTFKIVNGLIGLQTGVITDDSMVIKWDGVTRFNEEWNRDLNFLQAFRASAVPYFQEVARRIGKDTMRRWLDSLSYGNRRIGGAVDSFWLDGSLTITPDEQLGLVKRLYFNQLPFHQINQERVKRAMLLEDKPEYRLAYKTGWTGWDSVKRRHIGWVVGWVEENKHPYFFALNLESSSQQYDMPAQRLKILKGILGKMGFFKGQK
jgi:beta-lactamase class D